MKSLLFILVLITFLSFDILSQSVPQQLNYQGILKDASGNNIEDGSYTMVFNIYNESTGGTALWSETQSVTVSGGLFFVRLGSVNPITSVPFDQQHYLGITVNSGEELLPRTLLSPSPYSFMSMNVVDNAITTGKIQDGAVTKSKLGSDVSLTLSGTAGGDLKGDYPDPTVQKLQGKLVSETAPAVDQVLKWDGNQWTPSADATATGTSGGDITRVTAGNGLTGGGAADDVTLNVGAGDGITVSADAVALNTTYTDSRYINEGINTLVLQGESSGYEGGQINWGGAGNYDDWTQDSYQNDMRFFTNSSNSNTIEISNIGTGKANLFVEGNVGIGTDNPQGQLHVIKAINGMATLQNHVAIIENNSGNTSAGPDVLALKTSAVNPQGNVNLISFFDGNDTDIGRIEGNDNGGVAYESTGGDYAEALLRLNPNESIEKGDIVGVFEGKITRRTINAHNLMVVSSQPVVLGNMPHKDKESLYENVAFIGQVDIKVIGPVRSGDFIIPSGKNDGVGVAIVPQNIQLTNLSQIVGQAWESSNKQEIKLVNCLVGVPMYEVIARVRLNSTNYPQNLLTNYRSVKQLYKNRFPSAKESAILRTEHIDVLTNYLLDAVFIQNQRLKIQQKQIDQLQHTIEELSNKAQANLIGLKEK